MATPGALTADPAGGAFHSFSQHTVLDDGGSGSDSNLGFGFEVEAADATAPGASQADADLAPYGSTAIQLRPGGAGLLGATQFTATGQRVITAGMLGAMTPTSTDAGATKRRHPKREVPKLYSGGNVGPGMLPTEYLPVGKPNPVEHRAAGSNEPDRPIGGSYVTRKAPLDGFYEDAPDLAVHDRAVREALGKGDSGVATVAEPLGLRTLHVDGIGDVDVYDEAQLNPRDVADADADVDVDADVDADADAGVAGTTIEV